MKILITGGAGFLGKKLALKLLNLGSLQLDRGEAQPISKITIYDQYKPSDVPDDPRLERLSGDIADPREAARMLAEKPDLIYHLATIPSGGAEENFELGMGVNLLGTLFLLEAVRRAGHVPRFVFTSTTAVYGALLPDVIQDDSATLPLSSYGSQKAAAELLLNDYSRKGFLDGRAVRLPTIVIRPGRPNKATSTFASSIIREPLQGRSAVCPVSLDTRLWILSPRQAVKSLVKLGEMSAEAFGEPRVMPLPGISVSVGEMIDSLKAVAGQKAVDLIEHRPDAMIQRIVGSWPHQFNPQRALAAGFVGDESMRAIVEAYIEDEG